MNPEVFEVTRDGEKILAKTRDAFTEALHLDHKKPAPDQAWISLHFLNT
jgi:hypothetical protein